jgi:hypothetical protein
VSKSKGIKLGKPDVTPDKPSHTDGVHSGNATGRYEDQVGHLPNGKSTAARSTGINPHKRDPIIPGMPNLSPP